MRKKKKRSWFDIQMVIMTVSMAAVLALWNIFAGPDRKTAIQKAQESANQPEPVVEVPPDPIVQATPVPFPQAGEKIMLGGEAPQTQIIIQRGSRGGNGDTGGGGGVTSTGSS